MLSGEWTITDVTLDVNTLNDEQKKLLNLCAQQFGMKEEDYIE